MQLRIDSDALVRHTARLEKINRSALPVAVRQTLTGAAFDVKARTMPKEADVFVHRKPTFFKANSKVIQAKGFDIATMQSTVGFKPKPGDKSHSVEDLQQQEDGGAIEDRQFIAGDKARTGNSFKRGIKTAFRSESLSRLPIIDATKSKNHNARQRYIRAAIMAKRLPGPALMLGNKYKARNGGTSQTLSIINSVEIDKGKVKISRTPIYTYQKGRKTKVAGTNFMKRASHESGLKMNNLFLMAAENQIKKYRGK